MTEQNYKNHGRIVPLYHVGVFFPLLANFIWSAFRLLQGFSADGLIAALVAAALLLMFFSVRSQILTVQDRVIRLESRLRMREVLPTELAARGAALPVKLLVALRFASDAELPALVREVLDGKLTTPKDIKLSVKEWQADYLRA